MSVIKDALPVILPVLTELINRSLLTSVFPSAGKESVVIPILKERDHEVVLNLFCTRFWLFIEIAMLIQCIDSEIKNHIQGKW